MVEVMDAAKGAGVRRVGIVTESMRRAAGEMQCRASWAGLATSYLEFGR
jgi:hypothetical protein